MSDNKTGISLICSVLIVFFRFLESKFILKEKKSVKIYLRDFVIGFISSLSSLYIYEMIYPFKEFEKQTQVFISEPDF